MICPWGSPLSPILADVVIQDLKKYTLSSTLSNINIRIPVYYRYVNDILLVVFKNQIYEILDKLTLIMTDWDSQLSIIMMVLWIFFYISLRLSLRLVWRLLRVWSDNYRKSTNLERYLNYKSIHPIEYKKGVIIGQVDRILFLAHPEYHKILSKGGNEWLMFYSLIAIL